LTRKLKILLLAGSLLLPTYAICAQDSGELLVRRAMTTFGQGLYDESLRLFRNIILDSGLGSYHGDSYFWISKSYMALAQYENASKNLEFFLAEFPQNNYYIEGLYQRGRVDFLQGEYETAVQILEDFAKTYPDSTFVANSYFWIGESLYALGNFDEALQVFEIVESDYPTSFKIEAARYRISLIQLKEREQELLKLLKWSHEEYLRALEEFDRKERGYEQALNAYQRTIREYETEGTEDPRISALQKQLSDLQQSFQNYKDEIASLQAGTAEASQQSPNEAKLLKLKKQALDLKSYYLIWLSALQ
jgi:tetratricopeptide (TPR) repeat protein